MGLFSEELLELDRNTVMLMIEARKKELENLKLEYQELVKLGKEKDRKIAELQKRIEELEKNNKENISTPNIP